MPDAPAILLIGPDGMLGRAWAALLDVHGLVFDAAVYPDFDLTDPASVEQAIQTNHRLVINCAAWTDVDGAEAREEAAAAVNATGAGHLARRCEDVGAKLIHYSTDYVFPGNSDAPYRPEQPREPLGAYGRTKAAGEALT
ncbi:MAG: SDR family oxidoreductase, partial [Phycisphaeraceae bacterium]